MSFRLNFYTQLFLTITNYEFNSKFPQKFKIIYKEMLKFLFPQLSLSTVYCLLKKAPCSSTLFVTVIHIFYEYPETNYCIIIHFFGHNTFLYKSLPTDSLYLLFITAPLPQVMLYYHIIKLLQI